MRVELIAYTPGAEQVCGSAAGRCYRANGETALKAAMAGGHESVLEHAVFTFGVYGVSRVLLAQLTRHRLVSFSVESQRYTDSTENQVYLPGPLYATEWYAELHKCVVNAMWLYERLISSGVAKEDARYILPQGITTNLVMTANARELRHIFSLRCCNRAQAEIREMAWEMLKLCKEAAPGLFGDAGPGCVRGKCPEKRPCGRPYETGETPEWRSADDPPKKSGFYAAQVRGDETAGILKWFYIAESGTWYGSDGPKTGVTRWKEWRDGDEDRALFREDDGDDRK